MAKRDYSEVNADWNVPPSFGPIAHLVGRAHGRSGNPIKLSYSTVLEIKRLYRDEKMRVIDIARLFDMSRANVSKIVHGHSWTSAEVEL